MGFFRPLPGQAVLNQASQRPRRETSGAVFFGVCQATGRREPRSTHMLKLAGILLVLMIVFGILGFVVDVAGGLAKIAFFVCLVGAGVSLAAKAIRKS